LDIQEFRDILKKNKMSLKDFAEESGVPYRTITGWGKNDREVAPWVESWLELYFENEKIKNENNKYKEAMKNIEDNIISSK